MPVVTLKSRSRALAYAVLAILFVISCVYRVRNTAVSVDYIFHGEVLVNPPFEVEGINPTIESVKPEAETADLRKGDLLLVVDGHPFQGLADYWGRCGTQNSGIDCKCGCGRTRQPVRSRRRSRSNSSTHSRIWD